MVFEFKLFFLLKNLTISINFTLQFSNPLWLEKSEMFLSLLQFFFLVFRSAQFLRFNSQFQHFFQNLCDSILIFFVSLLKSAFILNFLRFNTHFFISARFSDNLTFQTHKTQIRNFGGNSAMTCNGILYDLCDWKIGDFSVVANC